MYNPNSDMRSRNMEFNQKQMIKLRSMQRAQERIMLNITWRDHKTSEWIREKTGVRDIMETVSKLKWNWAGHVARQEDNRWTSILTHWTPRGSKRNPGRPKTRWRDDLQKFQPRWTQIAQDRKMWSNMGKAYIQQRTFG